MFKLFVEYFCTDASFTKVVRSHAIDFCEIPEDAFSYRFVEKLIEQDSETVVYTSDTIYLGRIYSIEEALREFPEDSMILKNFAKIQLFNPLIRTRTGYWLPYKDGDTVIEI